VGCAARADNAGSSVIAAKRGAQKRNFLIMDF
jgi:hypothetical protein